jgi:hypothetical protein
MGTAFRVVIAFCIGLGALYGAQRMWLSHVMAQIAAQPSVPIAQHVKYEPIKTVDPAMMKKMMMGVVGPIDTKTGQRLAVESAARRIDLMNRAAQNAVPLPPRIPGFRH